MALELAELGLTQQELQDRVVDRICHLAMVAVIPMTYDEDGHPSNGAAPSKLSLQLTDRIRKKLDQEVEKIADKFLGPQITGRIESLVLQKTNKWGESQGRPVSFKEYLVSRAEEYLTEEVNHDGKPKGTDSYSWRPNGTRIVYLIDRYLQYHIENAMKEALRNANSNIVKGIENAVKIKLKEISDQLKMKVETK